MANTTYDYNLVVIGSGPGGYVAAIRAAQKGLKTAVVEARELGGVCLNWGCIPTKALLRSAEVWNQVKRAKEFGLNISQADFNFPAIIKRSRDVADINSRGVAYLFKKNKIEHIQGWGRIGGEHLVAVTDDDGKVLRTIRAEYIIIATGGRARSFPGVEFDGKQIISSREAMLLQEPPKRLAIIGAGAIGVEFAYFYNSFGSQVQLIEMMPHILPLEDAEIASQLERAFKKQGIQLYTGARVEQIQRSSGGVQIKLNRKGKDVELEADVALIAIGVVGNVENVGLEQLDIEVEKNTIRVDEFYRTSVPYVYAIGDVIGAPYLAHVASHEGIIAVDHLRGANPRPLDYGNIPGCTYCQPQVASIGLTEEQAKEKGLEIKVGRFPFRASGKARAIGEVEGMVKLVFDARYGELLGAHIIGPEATELIAELGIARTLETTFHELQHTVHAHPTLSEAIMEAAGDALGEAIHI